MPWVGFELTIPVSERAKTVHTLDRAATVIGHGNRVRQANKNGFMLAWRNSSTMKIAEVCSSETSVDFQRTTWQYIIEDRNVHGERCENFKSKWLKYQIIIAYKHVHVFFILVRMFLIYHWMYKKQVLTSACEFNRKLDRAGFNTAP
jgi:hypothetical protein